MKKYILLAALLAGFCKAQAQFTISADKHYLLRDGKPFTWIGDTAWELFHRLNRDDADRYLKKRAEQGFTVVQAVALAELDGIRDPNAYGEKPLIDEKLTKPNEKYFEHVDWIINKAAEYGITIGFLPSWADKLDKGGWGKGPEILNAQDGATYATWLAKRYKDKKNIIWILGGDRQPRGEQDIAVWRAMGKAIMKATSNKAIITYHCQPNQLGSAEWFRNEDWFAFNMFQTGHCRDTPVYDRINASYNAAPTKPTIDGEPIYEDHPVCFNVKDLGTSSAYDVRKSAYLDLLSGAFGHTYGCHDIWQMYSPQHEALNGPHMFWYEAVDLPGANQMRFVRRLIEARPMLDRVPDQTMVKESDKPAPERIQAARGKDYAFVYSAEGKPFTLLANKISGDKLTAYWYNPRDGKVKEGGQVSNKQDNKFTPPTNGYGQDWVLVLDDAAKGYKTL
ncbi:MAG: glycoside hydrolase family 140 protein [Mucilaginibacter sp.]|nr:glycoside hydrolase family 140 protein [Mucilaginibacter sp.]